MQPAAVILALIRSRGARGLPLEGIYRQLYNPELYLLAYGRIARNQGAMTRGVTKETADGMSLEKIGILIERVRYERLQWTPVRRVYIPKKNGKKRPLGIPTWSDKLLQEVMRSLLEAYYEPQFSIHSHGFRPNRGCHTVLLEVARNWKGTKWFIEGDIKGCFDNIDHTVLLGILQEKIHDGRFLRLVENLLKAGYLEDWRYEPTLSGTPQGGIISPILSNVYLDRLDKFAEQSLIPEFNRGAERQLNPEYRKWLDRAYQARKKGQWDLAKEAARQQRQLPYGDPNDPGYRRLHYIRYADDFLLGFAGPKAEAEEIKSRAAVFLQQELNLELSPDKTLITHARSSAARFLGYEIVSQHCDTKHDRHHVRSTNGVIGLRVPADVVEAKCAQYQQGRKTTHRAELANDDDYSIVTLYQSEYRGVVQYYALAHNIAWLHRLRWTMETSLLKTLAAKHRSTVAKLSRKLGSTVETEQGPRRCIEVKVVREGKPPLIARFGGVLLRRRKTAVLVDRATRRLSPARNELVKRLLADECEICGSSEEVQVHHVRKLSDLKRAGRKERPLWMQVMAARRRKTLVLCRVCHEAVDHGKLTRQSTLSEA